MIDVMSASVKRYYVIFFVQIELLEIVEQSFALRASHNDDLVRIVIIRRGYRLTVPSAILELISVAPYRTLDWYAV